MNDPLRTVTTKDRHGLVDPHGAKFDILFRMLEPDELKQGMGFGADYRITGNREEQVRQIGNAVEVNQAAALGGAMLEGWQHDHRSTHQHARHHRRRLRCHLPTPTRRSACTGQRTERPEWAE